MKFLHKLFFETKMTWPRVLLFSIATAAVAAAMLLLPFTQDTSLANIGVTFECWVLFALIIIMNCKTPLEAGCKTFVFFLISQPLIYLLEVPFVADGWGLFRYYPRWFLYTVLCFPGAMLAWLVKKDTALSAILLSVATGLLGLEAAYFADTCVRLFPKYLLSTVFCLLLAFSLIFILLKKKRSRILAFVLTLVITLAAFGYYFIGTHSVGWSYDLAGDGTWEITATDGSVGTVTLDPETGSTLLVEATDYGVERLELTNENGETTTLTVTFDRNGLNITEE